MSNEQWKIWLREIYGENDKGSSCLFNPPQAVSALPLVREGRFGYLEFNQYSVCVVRVVRG
jgi:hypothetical protein